MCWYFKGVNGLFSFTIIWGVLISLFFIAMGVVPYANLTMVALSAVILTVRRIRYKMGVRR